MDIWFFNAIFKHSKQFWERCFLLFHIEKLYFNLPLEGISFLCVSSKIRLFVIIPQDGIVSLNTAKKAQNITRLI